MATARAIEKFRNAAKDYLKDEKFSDFTIVCEDQEFKVHRCFISTHSPFFKQCCSGMFEVRHSMPSLRKLYLNLFVHRRLRPTKSS